MKPSRAVANDMVIRLAGLLPGLTFIKRSFEKGTASL